MNEKNKLFMRIINKKLNLKCIILSLTLVLFFHKNQINAQVVTGGWNNIFYLCIDSTVKACGNNYYGQLGLGNNINTSIPTQIPSLFNISFIASGSQHALFVNKAGHVFATGKNTNGELGNGTIANTNVPIEIDSLSNIIAADGGYKFSLFLKSDSTVWSCGKNLTGQLGDGTTIDKLTPVQVIGLTNIVAIAAGSFHSLFLKSDGTVWGCGHNNYGQLGDSTMGNDYLIPFQIPGLFNVVKIAAGEISSFFVLNNGSVLSCGGNNYGQLGIGTTSLYELYPMPVIVPQNIIDVSTSTYHTLFLTADSTIYTCGFNNHGQLGLGTNVGIDTPVIIPLLNHIRYMDAAEYHSVFIKNDSTAWACGNNGAGELGDGTTIDKLSVIQVSNMCPVFFGLHLFSESKTILPESFSVSLNPNIVSHELNATISSENNEIIKVEIFNIEGELIFRDKFKSNFDHTELKILMTQFSNGIYFLKTSVKDNYQLNKFIIQ